MTFDDLESVYKRYLHLDQDPHLLRIIYSIVLANRYDGSPIWAMLIGPAGAGKTEILMSLNGSDDIIAVSTLTPYSLASAHGDQSNSLLFQLDKRILVIEDMSAVNELPRDARGMLYSFLRAAYNGEFTRSTGKGTVEWKGKFGLLAGATPAIERGRSVEASLGERFLNIRMRVNDVDEMAMLDAVDRNANKKKIIKQALSTAACDFLEVVPFDVKKRSINKHLLMSLRGLAIGVAKGRSHVERDSYTKEVCAPVERGERATRVYTQMQLIACAARAIGTDDDVITEMMNRISLDALPGPRLKVLRSIQQGASGLKEVSKYVNMSGPYVQRTIEDLVLTKVIKMDKRKKYQICDKALLGALQAE